MAVRNRSAQTSYVDELNTDGVATQKELEESISTHISTFHSNQSTTLTIDGMDYFYDSVTDKYLSKQWFSMEFFDNDSTTRKIYLYNNYRVRCSDSVMTLPFDSDFLLSKVQVDLDASKTGNLFNVEDSSGNELYVVAVDGSQALIEDIDVTITSRSGVLVYNNSTYTNKPRVTLWFRLIHNV